MFINIYSSYKVKQYGSYSYMSEDYDDWQTEKYCHKECIFDGGTLLDILGNQLHSHNINTFCIESKNKIHIDWFDPNTGEASDTTYEFEEVKNEYK